MKHIFFFLVILFVGASCSLESSLIIEENGSGKMESHIVLADFFRDFFFDIFEKDPLLEEFRMGFANNGFQHVLLRENEDNSFTQYFAFADLNSLPGLSEGIIELKREGELQSLSIKINRDNWNELETLFPLLSDPSISYLGPEGSQGLSRDQFHEMLLYPFDGYAETPEKASLALTESRIHLRVQIPGDLQEVTNGTEINSSTAEFVIPLFDLLMLDREVEFRLSYL